MRQVVEFVEAAGAAAGSVTAIGLLLWFLVKPRIADYIEDAIARQVIPDLVALGKQLDGIDAALRELTHPVTLVEQQQMLELMRKAAASGTAPPTPPRRRRSNP